jgi:signal transduction histidine kinase
VGATASQGFRFNRAFLLLVDERRGELRGRDAIGPADAGEAHTIWARLAAETRTLREMVDQLDPEGVEPRVQTIVKSLVARLDDSNGFVVRTLNRRGTTRVENGRVVGSDESVPESIMGVLGVRSFVAVPLKADERPVGLLLADNAITSRAISDDDVNALELLGLQAAQAIERARLTERLARQLTSLESAARELRQNQERLVHSERLTAIGEMAARVAHEIRNPLVAIGGFARSLLQKSSAQDVTTREALEIIVDEVRRLETIVREVLEFSRATSPKIGSVDARKLAEEAFGLLQGELEHAAVATCIDEVDGAPPAAADRDQLFQAVVNLFRNAMHAMPRGGTLTVRIQPYGHGVELAIEDTGTGMSEDVLAHAYEPFFTTKNDGSGLGLTIAAQIVRDHRGEIRIDSREGAGTTVSLRLPAATEDGHA